MIYVCYQCYWQYELELADVLHLGGGLSACVICGVLNDDWNIKSTRESQTIPYTSKKEEMIEQLIKWLHWKKHRDQILKCTTIIRQETTDHEFNSLDK